MKNSPKLRFPEFVNDKEWEEKKLIDICERITQGGTPDTSNQLFWNGTIEWLTPAEMNKTDSRYIHSTARKITVEGLKNCSSDLLPVNSVILSTRAPIGHLAINTSEMAINQGCKGLIPKKSTNYSFLYYLLIKFKNSLMDLGAGNTFKELSGNTLKNFEILIPSIQEQQKIADCLSSVDSLISAQSQKVELLKEHKKGLMQQLFPQDGEEVPKLRFPEFKNAPKWEEKSLGSLCSTTTGKLDANAMVENGQYRFYTCAKNYYFIDNYAFDTEALLISGNGANVGYIHYYQGKFNAYQRTYVLDEFSENIIFIKYHLEQNLHKRIATEKKEGNTPYIVMSTLTDMAITLPKPEEQQKIANCLSFIDELIIAQIAKTEALKEHKKALMQQLFPSKEV